MGGTARIVCFGDSLTEGFGLRPAQALPSMLRDVLRERGLEAECLNFGVSGETAGEGLLRLKKVLRAEPDLCVVAFGTNDFFEGLEPAETEEALAAILRGLAERRIPTVLAGVRCIKEFGEEYRLVFDAVFPRLAERFRVPLLPDLLELYLHDPDKVLIDQLHPNASGVRCMAEALAPLVLDLLKPAAGEA